jgi:mono/diheme cytochrome c family protein
MPSHRLFAFAAAFVVAATLTSPLPASADAARGLKFAREKCATCHALGASGRSRHRQAPPFREIAKKYNPDDLGEAFAEGIVVGHRDMPEFSLSVGEIGDLTDYLKRLARRR